MLYPAAEYKEVQNHGGPMTQHLGLVLHVQQGDNSLYSYFNEPTSQVSSHFWVAKTGAVEQYVDTELTAWAEAAGNGTYLSVETEGWDYQPLTTEQITALAGLLRWCHDQYQIPLATADTPGQPGLAWHGMGGAAWGNHPDCPGTLRLASRPAIIQYASGAVIGGGNPPAPPVEPTQPYPAFPGRLMYVTSPLMSGNDVRMWQQQMQNRGWALAADGSYGPLTEGICKQFQQQKGLTVDGTVGPITWDAAWTEPVTRP
jgi:hypothetical protein